MINLDRVDRPVSILESAWVGSNVRWAGSCKAVALGVASPVGISVVTAEGGVEDDLVAGEVCVDVTTSLEVCLRKSPARWVWRASSDVRWDRAAWEEPDADVC